MVQDKYRDYLSVSRVVAVKVYPRRRSVMPSMDQISGLKQAPSCRRRNSAPGAAAMDCSAAYHHHHLQQQQQQVQQSAGYQDPDEDSGFRPKATLEEINSTRHSENLLWQQRKWLAIETKFSALITIEDKRRAERDTIIMYSIAPEEKACLLHSIYKEARTKRIQKYDESLRLQQRAVEKNDVFTCADAANFLQCGDNGLVSMVKYKMRQVQLFVSASNSRKRCMPFIFYRSSIDDSVVQHCMREAHKEKRTYELMYERYCRFH
jgi:hypothetical protein